MTREGFRLTSDAEAENEDFSREYGYDGNCSCHLSPPCASCTHPGNPINQDEDDTAWEPEPIHSAPSTINFSILGAEYIETFRFVLAPELPDPKRENRVQRRTTPSDHKVAICTHKDANMQIPDGN